MALGPVPPRRGSSQRRTPSLRTQHPSLADGSDKTGLDDDERRRSQSSVVALNTPQQTPYQLGTVFQS